MAAVFQFKTIKPKALDIAGMQRALLAEANRTADDIEKDFAFTVITWNNPPKFEKLVEIGRTGVAILVGTDDEIYNYVSNGTSVRHALMSPDWQSKTAPGRIPARRGSGQVVAVGKNIVRPGIEAREFDKQIAAEWEQGKFRKRMEKAMKAARKASGWAI